MKCDKEIDGQVMKSNIITQDEIHIKLENSIG
jgi:hypothetical protein